MPSLAIQSDRPGRRVTSDESAGSAAKPWAALEPSIYLDCVLSTKSNYQEGFYSSWEWKEKLFPLHLR